MRSSGIINALNPRTPKGLIRHADEWVTLHGTAAHQLRHPQPKAWAHDVFPAETALRLMPHPYPPTPAEEFRCVRWTATPAARLYYLQGCRILGDEGAVISPDNRVFADFTLPPADDWREHSCFQRRRIPPVESLKGWYATIAWPESKFFFHWLMESLPRMALLQEVLPALDGIFVPGPVQAFQADALAALGVARDKLIPLSPGAHFAPEHLFVPQAFAMYNLPRWAMAWYQRAFAAQEDEAPPLPARVYISRADAPQRRVANEAALMEALGARGFVALRLSDLGFLNQARLFRNASTIIAPHGAGLSNLVFCQPGAEVLEIFPPRWMPPCFMSLAVAAGCDYRHLVARQAHGSESMAPQFADIEVDIDAAINQVEQMDVARASKAGG